jgi:hypothetical protein
MTDVQPHTEDWETLPWKQFERTIYRAQGAPEKRIYKASLRGDFKRGAPWAPQLTTAAASFVFSKMPALSERVVLLLNRQQCRCTKCGLHFRSDDLLEVHHKDRNRALGAPDNSLNKLELLHGHCHNEVHRELWA